MKNKMFAAVLISTAVIASAPAFAGNLHVDDDVSSRSGVSTKTRAQVREELVQAEQQPVFAQVNNHVYYPNVAQQDGLSKTRAEVSQELVNAPKQVVAGVNEHTMYPTSADAATSYTTPAVALTQGNGQAAAINQ